MSDKIAVKLGTITIDVFEDDFEVSATKNIDLETVYLVCMEIQNYLENLSKGLDLPAPSMLQ